MILPTHIAIGQKDAHLAGVTNLLIEPLVACAMVDAMELPSAASSSCNSVFRYPSPFGWSCGVPAGSPDFLRHTRAKVERTCLLLGRCCTVAAEPAEDAGRAEGTGSCGQRNWRWHSLQPSALRPVATRLDSKPRLARARGHSPRRSSTAISSPARLSRVVQTSLIARSTPTSADRAEAHLNSLTALRSAEEHKPSTRESAAVAFLLPMSAAHTAGQDQRGR